MEQNARSTTSRRKVYARPRLINHGDVNEITRQGGHSRTDVPQGTPTDGDITNVAS